MTDVSLKGRLIVAAPRLGDENFDGTVVLMLEHSEDGAVGLVLNRPTEIAAATLIPDLDLPLADPDTIFLGGPVGRDEAVGLARVPDGVRLVHLSESDAAADIERVRVFVGHAGWGPGQVESELEAGAWFVVEPDPADPFTREPDALWRAVLARQGGVFTTVPPDPSLN